MKPGFDIVVAAAMAFAGLGASAWAAPVDLSSGSAGFVGSPGAGGFSDSYTFTLASANTVNVLLGSVVGGSQNLDFGSVVLSGPGGTFRAEAFKGDPFESWVIRGALLTPGAYTLTAAGSNSLAAASYAGSIALAGSSTATPDGAGGPLDLSSGSTGFVHTAAAGAFSDTYSFSLASASAINLWLGSAVGGSQSIDFTDVVLTGPSGVVHGMGFSDDPFESWTLASPVLAPGSYTLTASGINSDAMATYVGNIAVAGSDPTPPNDVPEPGTCALLLAGLAAANATRRRGKLLRRPSMTVA
ncbi:FxDxF family PEP-CTERM protein [Pseudorhodoferax sp.]|uniref:FxDxF family PEP-CTERM protein n=1 Tax=Pseudorhodoferax sp. TaxID=1993553 RepID=UPI002DD6807F|nr:FxDxF family PEP-CTERM protein [Pseudorhodoferax sp.]